MDLARFMFAIFREVYGLFILSYGNALEFGMNFEGFMDGLCVFVAFWSFCGFHPIGNILKRKPPYE